MATLGERLQKDVCGGNEDFHWPLGLLSWILLHLDLPYAESPVEKGELVCFHRFRE